MEIVAYQNRAGQGQQDNHHVALIPEEVAVGLGTAIELEDFTQLMNKPSRLGPDGTNGYRLLCDLRLGPGQQILAKKEHEEDEQTKGIQAPEKLAAEDHPQGDARDGPDGHSRAMKL